MVVMTSLVASSRTCTKVSLYFILLITFPGLGLLLRQLLLKLFKGKILVTAARSKGQHLGQEIDKLTTMERKKLRKEIYWKIED